MIDWKGTIATGVAGIKRNALPGLALQGFALLLVLAYYYVPALKPTFQTVADWKTTYGLAYSGVATAFFGGVIPFLFLLWSGQVPRSRRATEFLFYVLFWSYRGMEVDLFYRLQAHLFGDTPTVATIASKVLVDQIPYNILWAGPFQVIFFLWKENGFRVRAVLPHLAPAKFIPLMITILFSTWMVWIPSVTIIYCLPLPLQIPLANLVLCFWVLLLSFISRHPPRHLPTSRPEAT
jgi:hypothetical protein